MASILLRVIVRNFMHAGVDGSPMFEHGLERPLAKRGDAVVATRRAGGGWLCARAELSFAFEAGQKGIDSAFGEREAVVAREELDELIAIGFAKPTHGGQHA